MGNFAVEPLAQFTLKQAIKPLAVLCGCVFAWGLCKTLDAFVRALFGTATGVVGWIPYANRVLQAPLHTIESRISDALGSWALRLEANIGTALHQLGAMVRQVGVAIRNAHWILYDLAKLTLTMLDVRTYLQLVKDLRGYDRATISQATTATRQAKAATKQAQAASVKATHAQARAIALPGEIGKTWDIPALRERVGAIEHGAGRVWKWIRSHGKSVAAGAFIGTVAWALGKMGAGWIRCTNWRRFGERACRVDPLAVEDLLPLLTMLAGTVSVVEFVREAQAVEEVAIDALRKVMREFPGH